MERDDNEKKGHLATNSTSQQDEKGKKKLREEEQSLDETLRNKEKDNPSATERTSKRPKKSKENQAEGEDEDMNAQERGSYGHKSQDDAEKDGRRKD